MVQCVSRFLEQQQHFPSNLVQNRNFGIGKPYLWRDGTSQPINAWNDIYGDTYFECYSWFLRINGQLGGQKMTNNYQVSFPPNFTQPLQGVINDPPEFINTIENKCLYFNVHFACA